MKKLLVILMVIFTTFALAEINVTYVANMSTLTGMGATDSTYAVQIRGAEVGPTGVDKWQNNFLTWGDDSQNAINVGGDYWELNIAYPDSMAGWRMAYKVCYMDTVNEEAYHWEENVVGGNRMFTMPMSGDTVLDVAYVNNMYTPPYTPSDSVDVFFRINMSADEAFIPTDPLCMVGAFPINGAGTNMWSPGTYTLTQEGSSDFWNFHLKLDPTLTPQNNAMYRFHNGSEWSSHSEHLQGKYHPGNENRGVTFGSKDTTIAWVWWNDIPGGVFEATDTANILFGVDMSSAIQANGFQLGDTLQVRLGYELSSAEVLEVQMTHVGGTQSYMAQINDIPLVFGDYLYYQYYIVKDGREQREVYYNFDYDGSTTSGAERRRVIVSGETAEVYDISDDGGNERRMPFFRNNNVLSQNVIVHVECDLRPAFATVAAGKTLNAIQGPDDITDVSQITGVAMNGPFTYSGGAEGDWGTWGTSLMTDTNRVMYDDGTHGDATAGDSIYTLTYFLYPDSGHTVGQECKFGIKGSDNEGGEGGYGNNHIVNIDDSQAESYLYIAFGSINPTFYSDWTPTPGVSVEDIPAEYTLAQNYPNPFNPVTTISFSVPTSSDVSLTVFDMTGRQVKTLVNGYVNAGAYDVKFDGANLASGVYFYQLTANNATIVNKMVLMK